MEFSPQVIAITSVLFFVIAFLYSSVGHGGASGYLAVLSFFAFAPASMSTTALILNLLVAGTALIAFFRAKHLDSQLTWPFVITSVPAAFLGGVVRLSVQAYTILLAAVLLVASVRFIVDIGSSKERSISNPPPLPVSLPTGAGIGFVSGLVGVGGGIFLSPLMLFSGWADAKRTAATSAVFIFVNSVAGLVGRFTIGRFEVGTLFPLVVAAFLGGLVGSHLGATKYSHRTIRRILGIVLLMAAVKLLFFSR